MRDPRRRRRLRRSAALVQAAARPASSTSGSARRVATSAARGTGTATRASPATSSRTATCPLLEEMGYVPTMKFASGFEIFEYCQTMAEQFGFYDHCLFHTTVEQHRVGRGDRPLDGLHRSRRRDAGPLRDPRERHPHDAEAGPHRGHGDVRGRVVPHLALELRRRSRGQARRHHRHRRHRRAGHPRAGQGRRRALRLPAHAVDHRRARPARDHAGGDRAPGRTSRAGRGPGARGSPRSPPGAPRSRPTTTTSPARSPTSRSASSTSAG